MEDSLEVRLSYTQPHNIKIPSWINVAQVEHYRMYEHNRQKHESRDRVKYLRSKWTKRQYK